MTTNTTPGGFLGDPTEAFTPPPTSGCCGGAFTPADETPGDTASGCCGSAEATAAGQCCTPSDRAAAVDAGTGCCG